MKNRSGIALTVAIVVILMMTALAGFIYAPPQGGNPARYGPGAISSLAYNVFKSSYSLSNGRTLAYYRARAALVDAQERIRNNVTLLESSNLLTSFTSTSSKDYYYKMSTGRALTTNPPPALEWVWVRIGTASTVTGATLGLRRITITAPDAVDGT